MIIAKNEQLVLKVSTWEDWVNARSLRESVPLDYSLPAPTPEAESDWWQEVITAGKSSSYSVFSAEDNFLGLIKTFNHNEAVKGLETGIELFTEDRATATDSMLLFLEHLRNQTSYRQLLTLVHPSNLSTIGMYEQLGFVQMGQDVDFEDESKIYVKLGLRLA